MKIFLFTLPRENSSVVTSGAPPIGVDLAGLVEGRMASAEGGSVLSGVGV